MRRLLIMLSFGFVLNACSHSCKDYHSLAGISNPTITNKSYNTCSIAFDFDDPLCNALQSARLHVQHGNHAGEKGIIFKEEFGDHPEQNFYIFNDNIDEVTIGWSAITSAYSSNENPSFGYSQASGLGNATFLQTLGAYYIDATDYTDLTFSFGFYKPSSTDLNLPDLSCSISGGDTFPITYSTSLTPNSPAGWYYIKVNLPSFVNQTHFAIGLKNNLSEFIKVDDFMLSGKSLTGNDIWDDLVFDIQRPFKDHMEIPIHGIHSLYGYQYYFETTNDLGVYQSERYYFQMD